MQIQPIEHYDIPELVEMSRDAHSESKYSHMPFSERAVTETFEYHITNGFAVKVVAENIAGFFIGDVSGFVFTDQPIETETSYYIRPEYRGTRCFYMLMKAFMSWSDDRPQLLMPHFGVDNSKTYTALEKLGFVEVGRIYARRI